MNNNNANNKISTGTIMNSLEWRVNLVREGFQKELNLKMVSKLGFKYLEETKH